MGFDEHPTYKHISGRPILKRFPFYRKYRRVVEKFGFESRRAFKQLKLIDEFDKIHGNFVDHEMYKVVEYLEGTRNEMVRTYYQIAFEEGMKFDVEVKRVINEINKYISPSEFASYVDEHTCEELADHLEMFDIHTSVNVCKEVVRRFDLGE